MSDPIKVDAKLDATESVNTVTKALCSGTSRILQAWLGKKEADTMRHRMLTEAQTAKDVLAIASGAVEYSGGKLMRIPSSAAHNLALPHYRQYELEQEDKNLKENMAKALEIIETNFKDAESVDAEIPISPDWFSRWRREAKVISEPIMQDIWGRILAEKAVNDAKISYQTLDILKNISCDDALLFMKCARFIINGSIYPCRLEEMGNKLAKLDLKDAQLLVDCGLLEPLNSNKYYFAYGEACYMIFSNYCIIANKETHLYGLFLTRCGRELFSIIDKDIATEGQAVEMCSYILNNKGFNCTRVSLHHLHDGRIIGGNIYPA